MLVLAACVQTSFYTSPNLQQGADNRRIVVMPLDVELSELSAGGLPVPKADWTDAAETHITTAVSDFMAEREAQTITAPPLADTAQPNETELQLLKLHGAVGNSILVHQYQGPYTLPTKTGEFNWTLGAKAKALKDNYDADYALFVYVRDSYSSGGRRVVQFVGLLFGVGIPGGQQVGFASLVDLNTGQIVWFNRLQRGEGDLRTADAAKESVGLLLKDFPS